MKVSLKTDSSKWLLEGRRGNTLMSQRTSVKGKTESNTPENPNYGGLPTPPAKVIAEVHILSFQISNSFLLAKRTRKFEQR